MTVGTIVSVASDDSTADAAADALGIRGALHSERRLFGPDRVIVYGHFRDDSAAWVAMADLRKWGWAATQRPADDDPHLTAWTHRTQPIEVGDGRLLVCPPWAEFTRESTPTVEIDPGSAFGGGSHPTTRLLLDALACRLKGGERMLDVGCGSGVLAIAAARLGAASAIGIDVDPAAIDATRQNAVRNGLADRVTAVALPLTKLDGAFDAILANIGLEVLLVLAPDIRTRLAPGGWLGLSGISPAQVWRLSAAFPDLSIDTTPRLDDWAAIVANASL